MIKIICKVCEKEFLTYQSRIKRGKKFCSQKCYHISMIGKPTWNKGTKGIMKPNKTSFKKGVIPWCFGKKLTDEHRKNLSKNHADFRGNKSYGWKGQNASYGSKHRAIQTIKGKPIKCEYCEKIGSGHQIHWANKDHKYSRNPDDYISLCASCHQKYDIKHNGYIRFNK